jgi:hypothetical protein
MSAASIKDVCSLLASRDDARTMVASGRTLVPLLALLEHPLSTVDANLQTCLLEAGFSQAELAAISTKRIALYALTADIGEHWRERAISWFEDGLSIDEPSIIAIRAVEQNSTVSQSLRHRARSLKRKYEVRDA